MSLCLLVNSYDIVLVINLLCTFYGILLLITENVAHPFLAIVLWMLYEINK